jgi:uncharacterized protein
LAHERDPINFKSERGKRKMAKTTLKSHDDLVDFVQGCLLFATGGGGNPAEGLKALEEQFSSGKELSWVDAEALPAGTFVACAFFMGSSAPLSEEKIKQMHELGMNEWLLPRNLPHSVKFLENYTGKKISALIPLEIGGSNMPVPVATAASLGIFALNGDFAGRAVPEILQGTAVCKGVSITPYSCVDKWGNRCIVDATINMDVSERLGKFISDASFGSTGICGLMIPVEELSGKYVPNTMDEALACGRLIRAEKLAGRPIADAICEKFGTYKLFRGRVVEKPWEDREGYYWGSHIMEGIGEFVGHRAEVSFKNENHLFYYDGELVVSSPDSILNVDEKLNESRRNEDIFVGDVLTILGRACKPELREMPLLSTLEPRHFGVDKDYTPIEESVLSIKL